MLKIGLSWAVLLVCCVSLGCSKSDGGDDSDTAKAINTEIEIEEDIIPAGQAEMEQDIVPLEPITIVNRDLGPLIDLLTGSFTEEEVEELDAELAGLWMMISEGTTTKTWITLNGTGQSVRTFTSYRIFSLDTEHPDAIFFDDEELAALPPTAYFNLCTQSQARYIYEDPLAEEADVELVVELPAVDSNFLPVYPFLFNANGDQFTIPANHLIFGTRNTNAVNVEVQSNSRLGFGQIVSNWEKAWSNGTTEINESIVDSVAIKIRTEMARPVGTLSIDNVVTMINCFEYADGTFNGEGIEGDVVETAEGTYTAMGILNVTDSYRGFAIEAFFVEGESLFFDIVISNNGYLNFDDSDQAAQYFIFENGPVNYSGEVQTISPDTGFRLIINYVLNL